MLNNPRISQLLKITGFPRVCSNCYSKQAAVLTKLIHKSKSKRNGWRNFDEPTRPALVPSGDSATKIMQNSKRTNVLNKLFMRAITDLMATGKSSEIVGLGVEVTKVKISADFTVVNVYWVSHGREEELKVSNILSRAAGVLREELTFLRIVGKMPLIQFVRDRTQNSWKAVENILKTADMGEDYVPRGVARLKDDFGNDKSERGLDDLPTMRQNVLGIDREGMLERILKSMKGRKNVEKHTPAIMQGQYQMFDQEAFASFLKQRKIMREKAEKDTRRDLNFVELDSTSENPDIGLIEEEDYLEDEYDDDQR